jgi:hypothetical protein
MTEKAAWVGEEIAKKARTAKVKTVFLTAAASYITAA